MGSQNVKGFTLVEIVVVIAVFGVLLLIAAPDLLKWRPNVRLKSDARDLYSNLQLAKFEAVKRNKCVGVKFTLTTLTAPGGYISFLDDGNGGGAACNKTHDGAETLLSSVTFTNETTLDVANFGGASAFCFNPTSVACNSQGGNVQLGSTITRTYTIDVKASGSLSIN